MSAVDLDLLIAQRLERVSQSDGGPVYIDPAAQLFPGHSSDNPSTVPQPAPA